MQVEMKIIEGDILFTMKNIYNPKYTFLCDYASVYTSDKRYIKHIINLKNKISFEFL